MKTRLLIVVMSLALGCPALAAEPAAPQKPAQKTPTVAAKSAPEQQIQYGDARQAGTLTEATITESSGIAASWVNAGMFWTHNDSGAGAILYLIDGQGKTVISLPVKGASAGDWEDIASFRQGNKAYLLIGDFGDNKAERQNCSLYLLEEPQVGPAVAARSKKSEPEARVANHMPFKYEDGPHNCESLGVDATEGKIYLVSKEVDRSTCKVYEMLLPKRKGGGALVAKAIATLKIPTTTGMDISANGRRAVVVTYGNAYEYTREQGETWAQAFAKNPRILAMPGRKQGESICYGTDGKSLYLTSEGASQPLWEVPVAVAPANQP